MEFFIGQIRRPGIRIWLVIFLAGLAPSPRSTAAEPSTIPGTQALTSTGDLADSMVAGVDRFLLDQTAKSTSRRDRWWKRDFHSASAYNSSVEPNRKRLAHILGVRDPRVPFAGPQLVGTIGRPDLLATSQRYNVFAIRWPAFGDVTGEGLLLEPGDGLGIADVVVVPDADQLPEQLVGLVPGLAPECQVARRLAESGCRVIVPTLINRAVAPRNGRARLTSREFIQRSAYELGRTIIGYEVQKVLALVDWLSKQAGSDEKARIGVFGYGEGGGIALDAAALDPRIDAACVSGYFDDRNGVWTQPVDRNVFGLLDQFGDAELATLVAPRTLIIEAARGPEFAYAAGQGGAPGKITTPELKKVQSEVLRARQLIAGFHDPGSMIELITSGSNGTSPPGTELAIARLLNALHPGAKLTGPGRDDVLHPWGRIPKASLESRQTRQLHELDRHNQQLLIESPFTRQTFMARLDTTSPEAYARTVEPYREILCDPGDWPIRDGPVAAECPLTQGL